MDLLTEAEVAAVVRLSSRTLRKLRHEGGGPVFRKLSGRVVYDRRDVNQWIDTHPLFTRTHQAAT